MGVLQIDDARDLDRSAAVLVGRAPRHEIRPRDERVGEVEQTVPPVARVGADRVAPAPSTGSLVSEVEARYALEFPDEIEWSRDFCLRLARTALMQARRLNAGGGLGGP